MSFKINQILRVKKLMPRELKLVLDLKDDLKYCGHGSASCLAHSTCCCLFLPNSSPSCCSPHPLNWAILAWGYDMVYISNEYFKIKKYSYSRRHLVNTMTVTLTYFLLSKERTI